MKPHGGIEKTYSTAEKALIRQQLANGTKEARDFMARFDKGPARAAIQEAVLTGTALTRGDTVIPQSEWRSDDGTST